MHGLGNFNNCQHVILYYKSLKFLVSMSMRGGGSPNANNCQQRGDVTLSQMAEILSINLWMAPFETFTQVQENTDLLLVFRLMHGPKMVLGLETE